MPARDIDWPPDLHPASAPVFTHNEIYIPSEPERVWARLIAASQWHDHYPHCRGLTFEGGAGPGLAANVTFNWRTFGARVTTTVTEFEPPYRLAWRAAGPGVHGYHGWVIDPANDGCRVVTQATQSGLFPSLFRIAIRRLLRLRHQHWLEGLAGAVVSEE
jgi:hypothetical protein